MTRGVVTEVANEGVAEVAMLIEPEPLVMAMFVPWVKAATV